jgi:hypothetical protein
MTETPYPSLADFAASWDDAEVGDTVAWAVPASRPLPGLAEGAPRHRLEDVLETIVSVQRAEWLEDGVFVGPRAMPEVYRDVLDCARKLRVAVPPAVISGCAMSRQGAFGTDGRAFLHLSTFFFGSASAGERRFLVGRLCGHVAARQVTWTTCYSLLVDEGGLQSVGRRSLGPALEVFLTPLSFGARLALSRWHRAAELSADRAGLLCCGELEHAGRALLRQALSVRPDIDPDVYLDQLRQQRGDRSPGRWAELLNAQPWTHKRLRALELFRRSALWVALGGEPAEGQLLDDAELDRQTAQLLRVG